eukprot:m.150464 g.150464  ORF g.150464 m.150464 type:complete len:965 (+) comp9745_c0_seq5:83-2977(+)
MDWAGAPAGAETPMWHLLVGALNTHAASEVQMLLPMTPPLDPFIVALQQHLDTNVAPRVFVTSDAREFSKCDVYVHPVPVSWAVPDVPSKTGKGTMVVPRGTLVRFLQGEELATEAIITQVEGHVRANASSRCNGVLIRVRVAQLSSPVYAVVRVRATASTGIRPDVWAASISGVVVAPDWIQPCPLVEIVKGIGAAPTPGLPETALEEHKEADLQKIAQNVMLLIRSGADSGAITIGINDAGAVVGIIPPGITPPPTKHDRNPSPWSLESLADELDGFFQRVFPPLPRDTILRLELLGAPNGRVCVRFSYRFPTAAAQLSRLQAAMHEPSTILLGNRSGFQLASLHPADVWLRSRHVPFNLALRQALLNPSNTIALVSLDDRAPGLPEGLLLRTADIRISTPAAAENITELLRAFDEGASWLVIACFRTGAEAALSALALRRLHLPHELVAVVETYEQARASDRSQPLLAMLSGSSTTLLVDIVSTTKRTDGAGHAATSSSKVNIQRLVESGVAECLQCGIAEDPAIAPAAARAWIEGAAPLSFDAYRLAYPANPQLKETSDTVTCFLDNIPVCRFTEVLLCKSERDLGHPVLSRCVGATTLARAVAYDVLNKRPACLAIYLPAGSTSEAVADAVQSLCKSKLPRPLVIIDDTDGAAVRRVLQPLYTARPDVGRVLPPVVLLTISRCSVPSSSSVFVTPEQTAETTLDLIDKLKVLYPASALELSALAASDCISKSVHFLVPVLTALCNSRVRAVDEWCSAVRTELSATELQLLKGLSLLACFAPSFAWVPQASLERECDARLMSCVLSKNGLTHRRRGEVALLHPRIGLALLGIDPSSTTPLPDIKRAVRCALRLQHPSKLVTCAHVLFIDRREKGPGILDAFSPLVLTVSCRLSVEDLLALCDAVGTSIDSLSLSDDGGKWHAHAVLMCSRYMREGRALSQLSLREQQQLGWRLPEQALLG